MERLIVAARPAALAVGSRYVREALCDRRLASLPCRQGDARLQADRARGGQLPAAQPADCAACRRLPRPHRSGPCHRGPQGPRHAGHLARARGAEARPAVVPGRPPRRPLSPAARRAAVEEAEAWGEREFQPLPRRFFRWALAARPDLRRWVVANVAKMPAAGFTSALMVPPVRYFARVSRATDGNTRAGVERLPELLDHVDALIADGTIG